MQQEKIEFPKFTVPGQTNWVKWALVGVGGLVALSAVAFGLALAKRNDAATAVAAPTRAADVPLAPSATPRPVAPATALAATAPVPAETAAADDAPAVKAASHRPHRGHTGHARLAKAASSGPSKSGKPDAIDELLKRFK
jgi:hypothetical protein